MRTIRLASVPLALLVAACSGTGASPLTSAPASPSSAVAPASAATSPGPAQTIEVKVSDALKIEPAEMSVKAGQLVKFVVTNTGGTDHEFYLGDSAAQDKHAMEMQSMGGMMAHDEENGISLKPGETKELTHTFATAGQTLAGCHVNRHYDAGMKATITVQ